MPFLDPNIANQLRIQQDPVVLELYKHTFLPNYPTLAFIGCMQVSGSLHPPAEKQSEWFNEILSGRCRLPSPADMQASIDAWRTAYLQKKAVRPFMVNQAKYIMELDSLIKAGLHPENAPIVLTELQADKRRREQEIAAARAAEFRAKQSAPAEGAESKKDK